MFSYCSDQINDENTGCDVYRDGILEVMDNVKDWCCVVRWSLIKMHAQYLQTMTL